MEIQFFSFPDCSGRREPRDAAQAALPLPQQSTTQTALPEPEKTKNVPPSVAGGPLVAFANYLGEPKNFKFGRPKPAVAKNFEKKKIIGGK